tara:strand:+ start:51 stop:749 length:699 start_codon:yes stop_codon:yes gene_type:complete
LFDAHANLPDYAHVKGDRHAELGLITEIVLRKAFKVEPSECTMVEIGSFRGESTEFWCKNFKKVYAVDPWQNGYDAEDGSSGGAPMELVEKEFDLRTKEYQDNGKLVKHKKTSMEAVDLFEDNSLDFVYIDGNHIYEYVKEDIDKWRAKTKILAGHDMGWIDANGINSVFRACRDFFNRPPDGVLPDTSWVYHLERYEENTVWTTTKTNDLIPRNTYGNSWFDLIPNYKGAV